MHSSGPPPLPDPPTAPESPRLSWVPIRSLTPRHVEKIATHLLALDERDRYLRFGFIATDEQVQRYVASLNFEHDEVFGIFNRHLDLIAMAHLAYLAYLPVSGPLHNAPSAEFGVSVVPSVRGRGYGARLFEHAMLHARNRGCERLLIRALSENSTMLKIALRAGARIERSGPDSEAQLKLSPDSLSSQVGEMVGQQFAELDYQLKLQAQRLNDWLNIAPGVKTHIEEKIEATPE